MQVLLTGDESWGGCMLWRWSTPDDDLHLWERQVAATIFVTVIAAMVIAGLLVSYLKQLEAPFSG